MKRHLSALIDMPSGYLGLRKAIRWIDKNRRGALRKLQIIVHSDGNRVSVELSGEYTEAKHAAINRAADAKGSPVIAWTIGSKIA